MNRREFNRRVAATAAVALSSCRERAAEREIPPQEEAARAAVQPGPADHSAAMQRMLEELSQGDPAVTEQILHPRTIALVAYPEMFPLDLLGPGPSSETYSRPRFTSSRKTGLRSPQDLGFRRCRPLPSTIVHAIWIGYWFRAEPLAPFARWRTSRRLAFLRDQAQSAKYLASVCTGALLLGAAELLKGYRATTHWVTLDLLQLFGAEPVRARFVEDRNRLTGGGVTAGLDLGLLLAARLAGETYAKAIQLNQEYNRAPPFTAGSPDTAEPHITRALTAMYAPLVDAARTAARAKQSPR